MDRLIYQITPRFGGTYGVWAKYLNSPTWKLVRVFESKHEARLFIHECVQNRITMGDHSNSVSVA